MNVAQIVPMSERKQRHIPLDKIRVLNSRNRDQVQFSSNIRSIDTLGLLKPIVVNDRPFEKHGYYELVCGEGRFLAHTTLGKSTIWAEVINCDRKTALLMSLVENIARVPPKTMWFAREIKRMSDCGMTLPQISGIVGRPERDLADYIRLVEMGEDRLIVGIEQGLFSVAFGLAVAKASDQNVQQVLMDAFDSGIIDCTNVSRVRTMIELRVSRGKQPGRSKSGPREPYTLRDLERDIVKATDEKEGFVREGRSRENRVLNLLDGLDALSKDERFAALLAEEGIGERPALIGNYAA